MAEVGKSPRLAVGRRRRQGRGVADQLHRDAHCAGPAPGEHAGEGLVADADHPEDSVPRVHARGADVAGDVGVGRLVPPGRGARDRELGRQSSRAGRGRGTETMATVEVFTVGGGEYIVNVFNAVAAWTGQGGYKSLLQVVLVMGFTMSCLVLAFNSDWRAWINWFLQGTLMYMCLMVAKGRRPGRRPRQSEPRPVLRRQCNLLASASLPASRARLGII